MLLLPGRVIGASQRDQNVVGAEGSHGIVEGREGDLATQYGTRVRVRSDKPIARNSRLR